MTVMPSRIDLEKSRGFGIWWQYNRLGWHWDYATKPENDRQIADFSFELYIACYWVFELLWWWSVPVINPSVEGDTTV